MNTEISTLIVMELILATSSSAK